MYLDALRADEVALLCSDVGPGDHVIVPSLTMVAVANGVKLCGATPIYADNHPGQFKVCIQRFDKIMAWLRELEQF